jgi:hypothetical protein
MNQDKIEEIVEQIFSASEIAAWHLNDMEQRLEEAGYSLTRSGKLQLRAALEEMAEDHVGGIVSEINNNLDIAGLPSSDGEADEILAFLRSDAGETFQGFFMTSVFKVGAMILDRKLNGNAHIAKQVPIEELVERMEEAEPHELFELDSDGQEISPDGPLFKTTP